MIELPLDVAAVLNDYLETSVFDVLFISEEELAEVGSPHDR